MKRRTMWIGAAVAAVALGAGAVAVVTKRPKPKAVEMATVGREDLQAKVSANGKVQAQKKVDISATIPGQVTQLAVREGDAVTKGQFLLQIDATSPRAAARSSEFSMQALREELDSARSSADQARSDLRRAQENHRAGILAEADLQRAATAAATADAALLATERRVDQARATLEGLKDTLSKTTVRSPMDGIVTARRIEEGEVAVIGVQNQPGTVLLTISDMSVVEAEMEIDETSIPSVALGQKARVHIDAYPNKTFDGVVTEVGSSPILQGAAQAEAIKFKVKVRIENPPEGIKPGLSVQADILTGFRAQALVVPIQALVVREDEQGGTGAAPAAGTAPTEDAAPPAAGPRREVEGVFLVVGGKTVFRAVETGLLGELSVEVVKGLEGGETIVTGPFRELRSLKPGESVRRSEPGEAAPPEA